MRFSERMGFKPVREQLQVDEISDKLKNALWNGVYEFILKKPFPEENFYAHVFHRIWLEFLGYRVDKMPNVYSNDGQERIREYIGDWYFSNDRELSDYYELVEFTFEYGYIAYINYLNKSLKEEKSAYRIVDNQFLRITSEEELQSVRESVDYTKDKYKGVHIHLRTSIRLLSDRKNPDYRNSIKESISAVESISKTLVNNDKATLSQALKLLEKQHQIHPALLQAYKKLYGYTNDEDGIRHAIMDDGKELDYHDAKYMLVTCTAFINLMIGKLDT